MFSTLRRWGRCANDSCLSNPIDWNLLGFSLRFDSLWGSLEFVVKGWGILSLWFRLLLNSRTTSCLVNDPLHRNRLSIEPDDLRSRVDIDFLHFTLGLQSCSCSGGESLLLPELLSCNILGRLDRLVSLLSRSTLHSLLLLNWLVGLLMLLDAEPNCVVLHASNFLLLYSDCCWLRLGYKSSVVSLHSFRTDIYFIGLDIESFTENLALFNGSCLISFLRNSLYCSSNSHLWLDINTGILCVQASNV